tara:strand:- start:315 stop:644 length:330 start_codon:yes stop_codon:yes gene_type:complete
MNDNNNAPSSYPSINVLKAIARATGRLNYINNTSGEFPDHELDIPFLKSVIQSTLKDLKEAQSEFDKVLQDHRTDIKTIKYSHRLNQTINDLPKDEEVCYEEDGTSFIN